MGIFDRFNQSKPPGRTFEARPVEPSEDEQALARYRYMLKTAPPETIEQAHAEAFAKLTPQQRRMLLEQLQAEMPPSERAYATAESPQALARLATRAEVRQPGMLERVFNRVPGAGAGAGAGAAPGFGGIMASSLLGSVAGTVLGTMIAQNFLHQHGDAAAGHQAADLSDASDTSGSSDAGTAGMDSSEPGDFGSDFDGGSIEI